MIRTRNNSRSVSIRQSSIRYTAFIVAFFLLVLAWVVGPAFFKDSAIYQAAPKSVQAATDAQVPNAEAFGRVCNHSGSPRSLPIGTGRNVQAYVTSGTCTGPARAFYDYIYIPSGYYMVYNNTIYRREAINNYGWIYVSATASGTARLYRTS